MNGLAATHVVLMGAFRLLMTIVSAAVSLVLMLYRIKFGTRGAGPTPVNGVRSENILTLQQAAAMIHEELHAKPDQTIGEIAVALGLSEDVVRSALSLLLSHNTGLVETTRYSFG